MLNYENQLNLGNIYSECSELFAEQRPEFLNLMEQYLNSCIKRLKSYFKAMGIQKSDDDIYKQAYKSMPKTASADSSIRKMYSNGHFCYCRKFGIITNGLGIPRHIHFFDDEFKQRHKDFIFEDIDSPDYDKTLVDNKTR